MSYFEELDPEAIVSAGQGGEVEGAVWHSSNGGRGDAFVGVAGSGRAMSRYVQIRADSN